MKKPAFKLPRLKFSNIRWGQFLRAKSISSNADDWFEQQVHAFGVTKLSGVPIWLMWTTIFTFVMLGLAILIARPFSGIYMIRQGNPLVFEIPFIGPFMDQSVVRESLVFVLFGVTLLLTFAVLAYWYARLAKYLVKFAGWPAVYGIRFQKALAVFFFVCVMIVSYVSLDPGRMIRVGVALSKLEVYKVPILEAVPFFKPIWVVPKQGSLLYQNGYTEPGIYISQNQILRFLYFSMILAFILLATYNYIKFFLKGTRREIAYFFWAWEGTMDAVVNVTTHMFRRPKLTVDHPWNLLPASSKRYGQLKITPTNVCASCSKCEQVCPDRLITISIANVNGVNKLAGYMLDARGCTLCGLCTEVCPHNLITVHRLPIGPVETADRLILDLPVYPESEVKLGKN